MGVALRITEFAVGECGPAHAYGTTPFGRRPAIAARVGVGGPRKGDLRRETSMRHRQFQTSGVRHPPVYDVAMTPVNW